MTCFAITIGETCPSGLGTTCHPEDGTFEKVGRTFLSARLNAWHVNGDGKKARPACSRTVVLTKPTGRRRLRANVFTACLASGTIVKTGDSSPSLRMTCLAITIGETCLSGLGTTCHPEDGTYLKVGRTFLSARLNYHGNGERKKTRPVSALSCRGRQRADDVSAQMCLLYFR